MALPPVIVDSSANAGKSSPGISNSELLSAIGDKEAFYDLYIQLTNRAIELYARAGRRKFAIKLHGDLAALDLYVELRSPTVCPNPFADFEGI